MVGVFTPHGTSSGLVELAETVADSKQQISTSCTATNSNKFVMTGSGGLPSSPDDLLIQQATTIEPIDFISSKQNQAFISSNTVNLTHTQQIAEAQSWVTDNKGGNLLSHTGAYRQSFSTLTTATMLVIKPPFLRGVGGID